MTTQNRNHHLTNRTAGLGCFSAGLLGAALSVYKVFVNPSVPETQWSYPFDRASFTVVQVWFALQHAALLPGLRALHATGAPGNGGPARIGHPVAVISMAGFAVTELAAIAAAAEPTDSPIALLLGAAYGVFSLLLGAALMVTGVAVIREKFWQGWKRWIPLSLGIWLYVLVLPALAWSFVGAGFAIASWMLLFAALGWVLMRDDGEPLPRRTNFQRGRRPFPMARALRHKSQ